MPSKSTHKRKYWTKSIYYVIRYNNKSLKKGNSSVKVLRFLKVFCYSFGFHIISNKRNNNSFENIGWKKISCMYINI